MAAVNPFDWQSLVKPGIDLGMKAVGDIVAPDAGLQNARTNARNSEVDREIAIAKMGNANKIRATALPSMYTQLGYNPSQSQQMGAAYNPDTPVSTTAYNSETGPGLGSKIARGAASIGMGLAPAAIPAIVGHGASLAGGATGLGGIGNIASLGMAHGLLGLGAATVPILGAAALAGGLIWKHTQAHPIADKWVQGVQAPFDAHYKALYSAGLPPDQMKQAQTQSAQNYLRTLLDFSKQGGRNFEVAQNAARTFRQQYGEPTKYGVSLPF